MALGNLGVGGGKKLALFCSKKCPGPLIIRTHDLAHSFRDAEITVVSGFHSPVEQECLNVLVRGTQPVIICPARSLEGMRVPAAWRVPIQQGRLLLLSPFEKKHRRATADLACRRNKFVAVLADVVFVAYAAPGGKTEEFCRIVLAWGKQVLTFDVPENNHLVASGVTPIQPTKLMNQFTQHQPYRV
jgi:predicted Rossmann fold nucleotide-binding protein DprA/Smf involved in DNA uptake